MSVKIKIFPWLLRNLRNWTWMSVVALTIMMPLILSKKNSLSQGQNMVLWLLVVVLLKALTLLLWVIFMMFQNTLLELFFVILWNFIKLSNHCSIWRMKGRLKLFQHKVDCLILGNLHFNLCKKLLSKLKKPEKLF